MTPTLTKHPRCEPAWQPEQGSRARDMAAWQREWLEPYEVKGSAPFGDLTLMLDTGEWVYAKVKPGAPPKPRLPSMRNPAIEEVTPEKQAAIDSILPEQGSRARVR